MQESLHLLLNIADIEAAPMLTSEEPIHPENDF